ncbi:hypothetical protein BDP81DRAFT_408064 [Colletotrichum phormii]|uniref:Uncharacterized protein n=1 Tax=Colletotrichum phormii TaxID=359342 RepID=A0AAI9ZLJ9_9PEZI|nr:uncharacterized protein BDP81DRAFT_408064 [Colletotrichum phormii]KAK1634198.1 hypothetical protein BDP81DRAFT_408064 [Colletotrichum phormii]
MQPLWKSYDDGAVEWDQTPCRGCGQYGKHTVFKHRSCATMELESSVAARVLTDRAWERLQRIIKDAEYTISELNEEFQVANDTVSELEDAITKVEQEAISEAVLEPLRRALRNAQETRDSVQSTHINHKQMRASLYRQKMAMCDLLNVAEVREELAIEVCLTTRPTSRDMRLEARFSRGAHASERARWWQQDEFDDPEELGEDEQERYRSFLVDWKFRRRDKIRDPTIDMLGECLQLPPFSHPPGCARPGIQFVDEGWGHTSTPVASSPPVHSIKIEDEKDEESVRCTTLGPSPPMSSPETMSSPRRLLWGHTNDRATRGSVKREDSSHPASDDSIEEALGRAFRNVERSDSAGATAATGRALRTTDATRQARRVRPY